MTPIRYGLFARLADLYHGWRDGLSAIPPKELWRPGQRITTPHREALIRRAQDAFEYERLRFEEHRRLTLDRLARAPAGIDGARGHVSLAERELALASVPPTREQLTERRVGEDQRDERIVRARRMREHGRRRSRALGRVHRAVEERSRIEAEVAAAQQDATTRLAVARARVRRIHEHTHCRLAAYRRRLARTHPYPDWVVGGMSVLEPEIPGWAFSPYPGHEEERDPIIHDERLDEEAEPEGDERRIPLLDPRTVFGSSKPPADERVDGYGVAPEHFSLTRTGDRIRLVAHAHGIGPFIDGQPVQTAWLDDGEHFDFAEHRYTLTDHGTALLATALSPSDLVVHELSDEGGQRLTSMSFVQRKGTVVAILGPSGAGKSSLFKALLGELEEDQRPSGSLFFRDLDLRRSPAQLRTMLGFVPQHDDMYGTLTLRTMLRYADRLRSGIAHHGTRDRRITRLCRELGIDKRLDQLVRRLSGGQAKRASIALEMLSHPALLMLDEPTSGLDPNMDREVMTILRRYAENGRTVIVITHNVQHIRLAHRVLVVASHGRPVYFGPPSRVRQTLGVKTYADLMKLLTDDDQATVVARLAERYRTGAEAREAGREAARALQRQPDPARRVRQPSRALTVARQLSTLLRRQAALIWAQQHRSNARERRGGGGDGPGWREVMASLRGLAVVVMPLIIAAGGAGLAIVVSTPDGFGMPSAAAQRPGPGPAAALSLLTTLCMLNGQALTYSNVVSEWPTIRREYRTGIVPLAVLLAKWLVFAILAVAQSAIVVLIYTSGRSAPVHHVLLGSGRAELTLDLAALTVASMTLGLLISVVARKLEQAVAWTTAVSIAQIALNGITADLSGNRPLALLSYPLPARWGLAAGASSVDLRHIQPKPFYDAMWNATAGQYGKDLTGLLLLIGACFLAAAVLLHRRLRKPDR